METGEKQQPQKAWPKPELIVLVRNNAEEAVLTLCKTETGMGDPTGTAAGCNMMIPVCNQCSALATS